MSAHISYSAVLRALALRGVRLGGPGGPPFAFGGADGQLRDEAWAYCPACGHYGLRVDRLEDGRARVSCRSDCPLQEILAALARAVAEKAAA